MNPPGPTGWHTERTESGIWLDAWPPWADGAVVRR